MGLLMINLQCLVIALWLRRYEYKANATKCWLLTGFFVLIILLNRTHSASLFIHSNVTICMIIVHDYFLVLSPSPDWWEGVSERILQVPPAYHLYQYQRGKNDVIPSYVASGSMTALHNRVCIYSSLILQSISIIFGHGVVTPCKTRYITCIMSQSFCMYFSEDVRHALTKLHVAFIIQSAYPGTLIIHIYSMNMEY